MGIKNTSFDGILILKIKSHNAHTPNTDTFPKALVSILSVHRFTKKFYLVISVLTEISKINIIDYRQNQQGVSNET